jgi:hypothetical protein
MMIPAIVIVGIYVAATAAPMAAAATALKERDREMRKREDRAI